MRKISRMLPLFNNKTTKPLIILEMANNHMGDIKHGIKIINEFYSITKKFNYLFAVKFQFRDLDTFIHPDYKKRNDLKYIKRFSETMLSKKQFLELKIEAEKKGFITICTPFDEKSVDVIDELDFDCIKIASCSFGDWPLIERVVKSNKPIIASTAGAELSVINNVVSFFQHREKNFALMHCVGEYPTPPEDLQLNQIDFLRNKYPDVVIGYSTHEEPDNFEAVTLAVAKGAKIFEKHVGIKTDEYDVNAYSITPEQFEKWLLALKKAYAMCGVIEKRASFSRKELADLRQFKRGVFASKEIKKGEVISGENSFYAFPAVDRQLVANDVSKYTKYFATRTIKKNEPITDIRKMDVRKDLYAIVLKMQKMLKAANIAVPGRLEIEISHHYGLESFDKYGAVLLNIVNREYCKKLVVVFPGQKHPTHYHKQKEETFHILYGDFMLEINNRKSVARAGDIVTIERKAKHNFTSKKGGILEEISTTHVKSDSFYEDQKIVANKNRKTYLTYWTNLL